MCVYENSSFCQINTSILFIFKVFFLMCTYVCLHEFMCRYPQGSKEGIGLPGTGISNGFELPDVGAGNGIQFSAKEVSILTC